MPSLHDLPTEIIDKICEDLDSSALFPLLLTSKHIAKSAAPVLCRHIVINDRQNASPTTTRLDPLWGLLVKLGEYRKLRERIRSLKIRNTIPGTASLNSTFPTEAAMNYNGGRSILNIINDLGQRFGISQSVIKGCALGNRRGTLISFIISQAPQIEEVEFKITALNHEMQFDILQTAISRSLTQNLTKLSIEAGSGHPQDEIFRLDR